MTYENVICEESFAKLFTVNRKSLSKECRQSIKNLDFNYRVLEKEEQNHVILKVLKTLDSNLEIAGPQRKEEWERGWSENLTEFLASDFDVSKLIPKFVKRQGIIRFRDDYIFPRNENFETDFVSILRMWLFQRYFYGSQYIYEFGCGTSHNLVAMAKLFPEKSLYGLDWSEASVKIIQNLQTHCGLRIDSHLFDMFSPDETYQLHQNSGIFTMGALEQLGTSHEPFIQYLLRQKPTVCVHVETFEELYDPSKLLDYLALRYLKKRGYLQGYLTRLKELEREGRIEILQTQKTFGSLYHDGYSFVVWSQR